MAMEEGGDEAVEFIVKVDGDMQEGNSGEIQDFEATKGSR
jgi:hypothetical protein